MAAHSWIKVVILSLASYSQELTARCGVEIACVHLSTPPGVGQHSLPNVLGVGSGCIRGFISKTIIWKKADFNAVVKLPLPRSQRISFVTKREERERKWEKASGSRRCESHYHAMTAVNQHHKINKQPITTHGRHVLVDDKVHLALYSLSDFLFYFYLQQ